MRAIGIFKGGFYTQRKVDGVLMPYGIMGKLCVLNPRFTLKSRVDDLIKQGRSASNLKYRGFESEFGSEREIIVDDNIICNVDSELYTSNGNSSHPLTVSIDIDSIRLYGVPLPDYSFDEEDVHDNWRWLESLGVGDGTELGLYGYYFNNSTTVIADDGTRSKRIHTGMLKDNNPGKWLQRSYKDRYYRKGGMWFAGYAFSKCEGCKKWTGREVIQSVGKAYSYLCGNCEGDVKYKITKEVLESYTKAGYVREVVGSFEQQDPKNKVTVSPDIHLAQELRNRGEFNLAEGLQFSK